MSPIICLIIILGVFIFIPLSWKMQDKLAKSRNEWNDFYHTVITIEGNTIYLAGPLNRKAKKNGKVTEDNYSAKLSFENHNIVYEFKELKFIIPAFSIEKIMSGKEHYPFIRMDEGDLERFVVIKIKVGEYFKTEIEGEQPFNTVSKEGYDNTVVIELCFTEQTQQLLIDTLNSWIHQ